MFCVFRSLLIFSFSLICFSCRFLFDFSRSPSQHASLFEVSSLPLYFLFLFILFPSVLIFVSSCFLVSFTFSPFLNFRFFVFSVSLCFFLSNSLCENIFLNFCETLFSLTSKKNFVFSVYFSLGLFFPCLVFFCVVKNGFSFYITRLFLILLFNSVSLFSPF